MSLAWEFWLHSVRNSFEPLRQNWTFPMFGCGRHPLRTLINEHTHNVTSLVNVKLYDKWTMGLNLLCAIWWFAIWTLFLPFNVACSLVHTAQLIKIQCNALCYAVCMYLFCYDLVRRLTCAHTENWFDNVLNWDGRRRCCRWFFNVACVKIIRVHHTISCV